MATLQERIKERRNEKGFTLLDLADAIGVKEATMQRYESGEIKNVKHETVVKLAEILHCSPQYLMGWVDIPNDIVIHEHIEAEKQLLLNNFDRLNESGKKKAIEYVADLADNPKYQRADRVCEPAAPYVPSVLAAHRPADKPTEADLNDKTNILKIVAEEKRKQ